MCGGIQTIPRQRLGENPNVSLDTVTPYLIAPNPQPFVTIGKNARDLKNGDGEKR